MHPQKGYSKQYAKRMEAKALSQFSITYHTSVWIKPPIMNATYYDYQILRSQNSIPKEKEKALRNVDVAGSFAGLEWCGTKCRLIIIVSDVEAYYCYYQVSLQVTLLKLQTTKVSSIFPDGKPRTLFGVTYALGEQRAHVPTNPKVNELNDCSTEHHRAYHISQWLGFWEEETASRLQCSGWNLGKLKYKSQSTKHRMVSQMERLEHHNS